MDIQLQEQSNISIRFSMKELGEEFARGYLYIIKNDLHEEPYGLLEDVFVQEHARGRGLGTALIKHIIAEAKKRSCYKLIAQSRHGKNAVHALYEKLGLKDHGKNFRMDLI